MSKKKNSAIGEGAARFTGRNPSPTIQVIGKLTSDIAEGREAAEGFFMLPCSHLSEFSLKGERDFSPWPEEKFEELVASIRLEGVLHPIIVRYIPEKEGFYEILAGEHRWKASCLLKLEQIPARIINPCSDDKAKSIFTLTNIVSRELTLEDKIFGWSHYYEVTKGKTREMIASLMDEGIIGISETKEMSKRNIYRYNRVYHLHPDLRDLVINGVIGIAEGEGLGNLEEEDQDLLSLYVGKVTSSAAVKAVINLSKGQIPGYYFDKEGLDFIFSKEFNAPKETSLATIMKKVKPILKEKIKKEDFSQTETIVGEALDFYNKYNGNMALVDLVMEEYLREHPEDKPLDENE